MRQGLSAFVCISTLGLLADVNVRDFGAKGDGVAKDTVALQRAADAAHVRGERMVVPAGTYLTGTLWLRSRTNVHLERGAVLLGSPDLADYNEEDAYPQNMNSASEGWSGKHLILSVGQEDVAITGRGVIDGNGTAFLRADGCSPHPRAVAFRKGYVNIRDRASRRRPGQELAFVECRGVRVDGVTLRNMAMWTCFFHGCDDVTVNCVTVSNDVRFANTDGFDIDACRNVRVTNCDITTSDDALAVRCCTERLSDKRRVCENVFVSNIVISSECEGVRVGVGTGVVRRVAMSHLDIRRAGRGLVVQGAYDGAKHHGLTIQDVAFSDIRIRDVVLPVVVTDGSTSRSPIERIRFERINAEYEGYLPVVGGKGSRPRGILFKDCRFTVRQGVYRPDYDWEVGRMKTDLLAAICVERADDIRFEHVEVSFSPSCLGRRSCPLVHCDAVIKGAVSTVKAEGM